MDGQFLIKDPCRVCGDTRRYLKRIICVTCARRRANKRRAVNPLVKRAENREWGVINREKMNEYKRSWREKNKTTADYRLSRRKHRGYPTPTRPEPTNCEMCGKSPTKSICLDHCHRNNVFRGWLCRRCNTALGALGDNIDEAIERLMRYKSTVERKP